ncbi:MAG: hypothetical protein ACJ0BU_01615 [Candidatus Puniceispirillales bacterium]
MIANTFNNQLLYSEGKSMIRSASVISFSIHILIIGIAMYGLPKFGRQLPPDLTIISFEMLKVVEETNLEIKEEIQEKESYKEMKTNEDDRNEKKEIVSPIVKPKVLKKTAVPAEKPNIPVSPAEKPNIPVSPAEKPTLLSENTKPIQKPKILSKVSKIQKPITKPQIQKQKIKAIKNKTNPNALTSVLKTLEKIKETQKQNKIEEIKKIKEEKIEKQKRKDEFAAMKNIVSNALSSKPKNLLKPFGVSEIDILKKHISEYWSPPIGASDAENLIVDIFMEFNKEGFILKAEWVNKGFNANNSFYKAAANAAIRAVKDAEPMPLPISKFSQWKTLTLRFDPKKMFGGF